MCFIHTMWQLVCFTVVLVGVAGACSPGVCSPSSTTSFNCTSVKTIPLHLTQFLKESPHYVLATSLYTTAQNCNVSVVDSTCFTLFSSGTIGSGSGQNVTTLSNGSIIYNTAVLTELSAGNFYVNSTCGTDHEEFYIGQPCPGTYVVYLCYPGESYSNNAIVEIFSTQRSVDDSCLQKAEALALKTFPNLVFTTLPNTVTTPCICDTCCG